MVWWKNDKYEKCAESPELFEKQHRGTPEMTRTQKLAVEANSRVNCNILMAYRWLQRSEWAGCKCQNALKISRNSQYLNFVQYRMLK